MVTMPANIRNLTQSSGTGLTRVAAAAERAIHSKGSDSPATHAVVDALSDLLSGTAFIAPDEPVETRQTYEQTGYPDLISRLWALIDRPVGKAVVRTFSTQAVETPFGTVMAEVQTSAEYVNRALTPDEVLYLRRKGRQLGDRALPGDLEYLTHPERH